MGTRSVFALAAATALSLGACKGDKRDEPTWKAPPAAEDPWAQDAPASGGGGGGGGGGGLAGLGDPMTMLKNIVENLRKPGPYDAPDASANYAADQPHLAVMTLAGTFGELESYSWTGGDDVMPLLAWSERLTALATDPKLTGLLLRVDGIGASLPDLAELRAAFTAWKAAGKKLYCHTEGAANAGYLLLTACDRIALAPTGDVLLAGPVAMPVHLKGLLDRLGITADFLHVGAYKGAAEPLTRERPSKEMEEVLGAILDQHYATMVAMVAEGRPALDAVAVKARIDEGLFPAARALEAGLVDEVTTFEAFRDGLGQPWTRISVEAKADDTQSMVKLAQFFGAVPASRPTADHVALVYALGDVVDGDGDGVLGARQQIASRTLVPTLRVLAADDRVKAVVLRIDSGGGSALASELIWHAVAEIKAKKPVVVSMSDVAASGGYYIAAGATKIYAEPDTLTGSIGVVGGKLAPGPALAKLGVTTYPMGRGKRATMFASLEPWTADEKLAVQAMMESTYQVFVGRVAAGRGKTPAEIEPIAQGRVWTGAQAKQLGLVDELGGLAAALATARELGKVDAATALEIYPPEPSLRDLVGRIGEVGLGHLGVGVSTDLLLEATAQLAPDVAAVVRTTLAQIARFRDERVQAVALLPIVFR